MWKNDYLKETFACTLKHEEQCADNSSFLTQTRYGSLIINSFTWLRREGDTTVSRNAL
jgi:hypothetical protein